MKIENKQIKIKDLVGKKGFLNDGDWVESKDQDAKGTIRLIQLADIGDGIFKNKSKRFMNEDKFIKLNCTELKKGDILIARMPDPLGRACIFPGLENKSATVVDVAVLRVDNDIADNRFVMYMINTPNFRNAINNNITGTTRKRISKKNLSNLQIPLPSLLTQKEIVKELDRANLLLQNRKESIKLLDEYLKSVFFDMFGDPVLNTKNWKTLKFEDVGTLERGKSKHRPRNAPELLGGTHPLIQTGDVSNAGTYIETFSSTYSDLGLSQSKKWPKGTLCITIAANIAKTGILAFDACFPDSVVGFIPNEKLTNNEFILFWMSFLQKSLEEMAPESAQKNINLEILRKLDVIVPPIDIQEKFAQQVRKAELVKKKYKEQLSKFEDLFNIQLKNL